MEVLKGRIWKFGDNINTDVITPGRYLAGGIDEVKDHVLEAVNPRFAKEVRPGDFVLAGKNFGCGSSRESAPQALKALGVKAVIAESFARIFFRNAVAIGLPVLACPSASQAFPEGAVIELDLEKAEIKESATGKFLKGNPLPQPMLDVLNKGGIPALLRELFGGAK
jgi:3-isopropylmalate/(R)-2-methylmalate dehydratase small subunit